MMRNSIIVRTAAESDSARLAEIESLSAEQPWSDAQILEEFSHPFAYVLAADIGGITVGMLDMHVTDITYINEISVDPAYRRLGAGKALVNEALRIGAEKGTDRALLDVRSGNSAARALYESIGFRPLCVRKGIYRSPDDDGVTYEMALPVPEGI